MTAVTIAPGTRPIRMLATTVVVAVMATAVVGVALAARLLGGGDGAGSTGGHHIGDDVKTSFGIVTVEYVRSVDGLSPRSLAGASHGVSGLVDGSHAQIQAAVAITNRVDQPIDYTSGQFALLVTANGKTTVQAPTGGDLPDTRVLPHAGIEGHLGFTVPRTGAQLALRFRDPGRSSPIVIDLGATEFTPTPGPAGHSHG